jgi:hypothetical protein
MSHMRTQGVLCISDHHTEFIIIAMFSVTSTIYDLHCALHRFQGLVVPIAHKGTTVLHFKHYLPSTCRGCSCFNPFRLQFEKHVHGQPPSPKTLSLTSTGCCVERVAGSRPGNDVTAGTCNQVLLTILIDRTYRVPNQAEHPGTVAPGFSTFWD